MASTPAPRYVSSTYSQEAGYFDTLFEDITRDFHQSTSRSSSIHEYDANQPSSQDPPSTPATALSPNGEPGTKKWKCSISRDCKSKSKAKSDWRRHEEEVHKDLANTSRFWKCPCCGEEFARTSSLRRHTREKHPKVDNANVHQSTRDEYLHESLRRCDVEGCDATLQESFRNLRKRQDHIIKEHESLYRQVWEDVIPSSSDPSPSDASVSGLAIKRQKKSHCSEIEAFKSQGYTSDASSDGPPGHYPNAGPSQPGAGGTITSQSAHHQPEISNDQSRETQVSHKQHTYGAWQIGTSEASQSPDSYPSDLPGPLCRIANSHESACKPTAPHRRRSDSSTSSGSSPARRPSDGSSSASSSTSTATPTSSASSHSLTFNAIGLPPGSADPPVSRVRDEVAANRGLAFVVRPMARVARRLSYRLSDTRWLSKLEYNPPAVPPCLTPLPQETWRARRLKNIEDGLARFHSRFSSSEPSPSYSIHSQNPSSGQLLADAFEDLHTQFNGLDLAEPSEAETRALH